MYKVYIEYSSRDYERMFQKAEFEIVQLPVEADLICFTGGSDVSPYLYGENKHPSTYNDVKRDEHEKLLFKEAVELDIPVVGVCRGGQFLNVMNGGKMFQNVLNHTNNHHITDVNTGEEILVSSTHHQMMRTGPSAVLVAYADEHGTKEYMEGNKIVFLKEREKDCEVIYYPHTNSLCFQPHPEFVHPRYEGMAKYFFSLIKQYFNL